MLTNKHTRMLEQESAISPNVITIRGYRSVTGVELHGSAFKEYQQRSGLLIPIYNVHGDLATHQLRPDVPRVKDGKAIKYETPAGSHLCIDVHPSVTPLLDDPKMRLVITEGTKKVDAAISHGLATIGLMGVWGWRGTDPETGEKGPLPDWQHIAISDRTFVLCFDSDVMAKPSVRAALDGLAEFLTRNGGIVRYALLDQTDSGAKIGLDDFFAAGGTFAEFRRLVVDALPDPEWPDPQPFEATHLPAFPVDALPPMLGGFVSAVAKQTETDPALAATVCLGTLAAAARNRYEVELEPGYSEPTNLYIATFLGSGNRKSAVFRAAVAPIEEWERRQAQQDRLELARWSEQRRLDEAALDKARKLAADGKGDASTVFALREKLEQDRPPVVTQLIADDVTPEKLNALLQDQGGAFAILSPEGGSVFGHVGGRYSGMPNMETLLHGHAGDPIRVARASREGESIPRPYLTLAVSPQPIVAEQLQEIPGFRERGLAARFLACFPPSLVGYRQLAAHPVPTGTAGLWRDLVVTVLHLDPPHTMDDAGFRSPFRLSLTPDALRVWKAFQHDLEGQMRPEQPLEEIREWASKAPGAAGRIAALLHIALVAAVDPPEKWPIDEATMTRAIEIVRYYIPHTLKFAAYLDGRGDRTREQKLWNVLRGMKGTITKRAVWTKVRGQSVYALASDLDAVLTSLENLGYIRVTKYSPTGSGRPTEVIELHTLATQPGFAHFEYVEAGTKQSDSGSERAFEHSGNDLARGNETTTSSLSDFPPVEAA
ncbi:hypothetical protein BH09CHL1_BH09CHL1_14170 [soil metagenome]